MQAKEVKLKVAEAIQDDVNKGIIRMDSSYMKDADIKQRIVPTSTILCRDLISRAPHLILPYPLLQRSREPESSLLFIQY